MRRSIALPGTALAAALLLAACGEARPVAGEATAASRCGGCHGDAASASRLSGAHEAHAAAGTLALACAECHPVPEATGSPGHADGRTDVVFGARAGGAAARWDRPAGTCAVYCHGSLEGGMATAMPVWTRVDGTHAACGSCHGVPPPAPHTASASCGSCHPAAGPMAAGGTHVNGTVDFTGGGEPACGSCHGVPPAAPHTAATTCGSCHSGYTATTVNAALHRNGTVDATAQACGSCHGIPPSTGEHLEHAGDGVSCGTCHPGASPTSGGAAHLDGTTNVAAPGWDASRRSCANACHGDEHW